MSMAAVRNSQQIEAHMEAEEKVTLANLDGFLADGHVNPIHPGVIYREWIIGRRGLTVTDVAKRIDLSREMLHRILRGEASITAKTAIGLAEVAGNEPEFWLRAQIVFDLWQEREKMRTAASHQVAHS